MFPDLLFSLGTTIDSEETGSPDHPAGPEREGKLPERAQESGVNAAEGMFLKEACKFRVNAF